MNLRKLVVLFLAIILPCSQATALDDWDRAVDIAVCFNGPNFKRTSNEVDALFSEGKLTGLKLDFKKDKKGKPDMIAPNEKPDGFLIMVRDDNVEKAREVLKEEISKGLKVKMLNQSLFFPERNK